MTLKKIFSFMLAVVLIFCSLITANAYSKTFGTEQEMLNKLSKYEDENSYLYEDYHFKRGVGYHLEYRQVISVGVGVSAITPQKYGFRDMRHRLEIDATSTAFYDADGTERVTALVDYGYNSEELLGKFDNLKADKNIASFDEGIVNGRKYLVCRYDAEYTDYYLAEGDYLISLRVFMKTDEDLLNCVTVEYTDVYIPVRVNNSIGWFNELAKQGCVIGDVNADGVLSISDATAVQKYCAELIMSVDRIGADFNGDLKVDIRDATDIQKKLAGLKYICRCDLYPLIYASAETSDETLIDSVMHIEGPTDVGELSLIHQDKYGIRRYDTVINSAQEFEAFFGTTVDEFDREFFEEKSLVYLYRWYRSISQEIYPGSLYYSGGILNIVYKYRTPDSFGTFWDEVANYNIFYEVDKADIDGLKGIVISEQYELY